MFKEYSERAAGETQEKGELTRKVEELGLMRKKKVLLEEQIKIPMIPSEGAKVLKEYKNTLEMLNLIETDVNAIKEKEAARLAVKFERPTLAANDEDAFDAALRRTGEAQDADRLDARRKVA